MPQLNFEQNFEYLPGFAHITINNGTLTFFPLNIRDSVSFNTINLAASYVSSDQTHTFSLGLYSLTGNTLSIANSASRTFAPGGTGAGYISIANTSATQNITPGTWWMGLVASTSSRSNASLVGATTINPQNAFPGSFIGGEMTDSTNALPSSYATSNLDVTGNDAMVVPMIILSA